MTGREFRGPGVAWAGSGEPSPAGFRFAPGDFPSIEVVEPSSEVASAIHSAAQDQPVIHGQFSGVGLVSLFEPEFWGMSSGPASQTARGSVALVGDRLVDSLSEPIADRVTGEVPALGRVVSLSGKRVADSDGGRLCFDFASEKFEIDVGPARVRLVVGFGETFDDDGGSIIRASHRLIATADERLGFDVWANEVLEPVRRFIGFCAGPNSVIADLRLWTDSNSYVEALRPVAASEGPEVGARFVHRIKLEDLDELQASFARFVRFDAVARSFVDLVVNPAPQSETPRQALLRHAPPIEAVSRLVEPENDDDKELSDEHRGLRESLLRTVGSDEKLRAFVDEQIRERPSFAFLRRLRWLASQSGAEETPAPFRDVVKHRHRAAHGEPLEDGSAIDATLTLISIMNAVRQSLLDGSLKLRS